jgi:hypothetical protein
VRFRIHVPEGTSQWESTVPLFRVGRADSCALRFEGDLAKYSSWEHAEFSVDDDGIAYVTDLGSSNGTYVDGERITEATPLPIGAVVQIGGKGPRLEVLELTRPVPHHVPALSSPARFNQRWLIIGLAAALLLVVGFLLLRKHAVQQDGNGQEQANLAPPNSNDKPSEPPGNGDAQPAQPDKHEDPPTPDPEPPKTETPPSQSQPPVSADPWKAAKERGLPSYRLIAVEDPDTQTTRPFAGAVAVAPQALITTADIGVELARFRERGRAVKVLRDSLDLGVAVERVRIQAPFQDAGPEEQLYFDVAILSVNERLDGAATFASNAESNALREGSQLVCLAARNEGEPFDGFEELRPTFHEVAIRKVNSLSPEAGAPRVLSLHGQLGDNRWGSPLFNDQGHLVALYCDAAPLADGTPDRANHYAIVVQMGLVKLGVAQAESEVWVAPVVPPAEPTKKEPEK